MEELTCIIKTATRKIPGGFFLLPIVEGGRRQEIYRERVYCYELYHRLRVEWGKIKTHYVLNGEIDKQGHPYFPKGGLQPDFLIHKPRTHDNFAIIEVKPCNADKAGIEKDLDTLEKFREFGYKRCIYLVYGLRAEAAAQRVLRYNRQRQQPVPAEIWIHDRPGAGAFPYEVNI
jgi:hypothetical protein